jgi:hypothetical protein
MGILFYHRLILGKIELRVLKVDSELEQLEDALELARIDGDV